MDPTSFHTWLKQAIIVGESLRLDLLETLARRTIQDATAADFDYLEMLGCSPDDYELPFFSGEADTDHVPEWYAIVMSNQLRDLRSIENPVILYRLLQEFGWEEGDARQAVLGYPLSTLVESCGVRLFIDRFRRSAFGSWMPVTTCENYLRRLNEVKQFFDELPGQAIDNWRGRSGISESEVRAAARHSFQELVSQLQTSLERNLPLRIISDWDR